MQYSSARLTWHGGFIPENEIWVKLGGDRGGGIFKATFQIVNVPNPNSVLNTCVFCCFMAVLLAGLSGTENGDEGGYEAQKCNCRLRKCKRSLQCSCLLFQMH